MVVSQNTLKWLMRLYPPLFFQRIWVIGFYDDFKQVNVKVNKSLLNKNPNGSIFGGTIMTAADPFYPVMFSHLLDRKGEKKLRIWSKSVRVDFLKPALTNLFFQITLTDDEVNEALEILTAIGKFEKVYHIEMYNKKNEVCAAVAIEVYVRDLTYQPVF
ncbi:DUF4442 domain-containing protein [Mucilaginibacter pallidiroseus]|uniref:DUF4442 domain-containing protein n=2 Tax=Mucilaginibacter pallidiroseus TaxID=2599295 RepID=A0A563UKE8_9SPHI|nr:DUF4442 domain-containing protein [Mucilaginibacter pallidiroseus]